MVSVTIKRNGYILDKLFSIIGTHGFICGGFARYCCSPRLFPEKVSDIDVYCKSENDYEILLEKFGALEDWEKGKETPISVNFKTKEIIKLQLIKALKIGDLKTLGEPEEVLEKFDFTIARAAITGPNTAICDEDFERDETGKKLIIKRIHCPIAQVYRIAKYVKKGYWIDTLEVIKIFNDWDERDPEYKTKLMNLLQQQDPTEEEIDQLEALLHID